ncbi:MAG: DNA polymerase III subunit delta [Deltaproteobacteria bacterium]|nr:DNA polymerase III subunit delta [Deltaproteobacteria bacterium]
MARAPLKPVLLVYGNQPYSLDQASAAFEQKILGDLPRDFAYHRFDAAELIRSGGGESAQARLEQFQIACESVPMLGGRYLVRLDGVEKVRPPSKGQGNILRQLEETLLYRTEWAGREVWAAEGDLPPGSRRNPTPLTRWVMAEEGPHGWVLTPSAGDTLFLLAKGDTRHLLELGPFLKSVIKGRFLLPGEEPEEDAPPIQGTGKLHALLLRMVKTPPEGCHLLLTAQVPREKDISAALLKAVKENGALEKFITYEDHTPTRWVVEEGARRGVTLNPTQADLVIHYVGNDLGRLAQELEKLALLFGSKGPPTIERLAETLHDHHGGSAFQLNEKLGERDLEGALAVLRHVQNHSPGEHPMLVALMARHFRQLYLIHGLEQLGEGSEAGVAARLKIHPFIAQKMKRQAHRFTPLELERILQALAQLDRTTKLHSHLAPVLFQDLAEAVCRGRFHQALPHYRIT